MSAPKRDNYVQTSKKSDNPNRISERPSYIPPNDQRNNFVQINVSTRDFEKAFGK